jgi:D-aminopeptidase
MKIYLLGDVSRISGILGGGNGLPPWYWFPKLARDDLRLKMTAEINKAAKAALRAGATEILAHEACPMDIVSLDEEVKLIRGGSRLYLDKSFAGIAFIGQGIAQHAASANGIENNIRKIEFNGLEVDEMTICALYAFSQGVPTLCASGADGCFKNLKKFMPDMIIHKDAEQAMTKGLEKFYVGPLLAEAVRSDRRAASGGPTKKLISPRGKIDMTFHFGSEELADMHALFSNVVKTGKTTTRVRAGNMPEAFAAYCSSGLIAAVDWLKNPNVHKSNRK